MNRTLLILDDEPNILRSLEMILKPEGFTIFKAQTIAAARAFLREESIHFFIVDVILPDGDGIEFIEEIRAARRSAIILVISGHASIKMAVDATRKGADDFLEKPLSKDKLLLTLRNFIKRLEIEEKYALLRRSAAGDDFIGKSANMLEILDQIKKIAPTNSKVLITGESGTGKEIVAHLIHQSSQRSEQNFVKMNCAAIPEDLIESELFGVEKGAFTGASERRDGKFKQADGGTLFLDEIGDMSLKTQTKVLRVLQDGEFERVGGKELLKTDVRIIAATNRNLKQMVAEKLFREDLYFRLHVVPIHLPPLRERIDDLPVMLDYFVAKFSRENNKPKLTIHPGVIEKLKAYPWHGNVRELKNVIERMVIMADGAVIDVKQLPADILSSQFDLKGAFSQQKALFDFREDIENQYIRFCLDQLDGNISQTARILQVDRTYLHRRLKKMNPK
ncbi:sigma-54-dependent Fis family transcriptional regulator [candidate division KSB1 bacterium]|nr:sigma-54-dependent Fis family transcriptional regulator [candidate division KSB1 bacterium]